MSPINGVNINRIGEILNHSINSAVGEVSSVLEKEVQLSTLNVSANLFEGVNLSNFEPAVLAEYNFTKGLDGKGVFVFKEDDVKKIVGVVLQKEFADAIFELDEINVSAINEVLSPLAKACYSSVENMAGINVEVSDPKPIKAVNIKDSLSDNFINGENVVVVKMKLVISDVLDSEMLVLLKEFQAKEMTCDFPVKQVQQKQEEYSAPVNLKSQEPVSETLNSSSYEVKPAELNRFGEQNTVISNEDKSTNLNMIMNVPLEISVEIGNTKKQIRDILDLTSGSIIELNKQAGAPVDVFVNGKLIANGEVVVVDEYYGVKISEILNNGELIKLL